MEVCKFILEFYSEIFPYEMTQEMELEVPSEFDNANKLNSYVRLHQSLGMLTKEVNIIMRYQGVESKMPKSLFIPYEKGIRLFTE